VQKNLIGANCLSSFFSNFDDNYLVSYVAYAAASPRNFFEAKLIRFGQIWKFDEHWAKSKSCTPQKLISYSYVKVSYILRQCSWDDKHEHERRK